jgi:hypothetical protein
MTQDTTPLAAIQRILAADPDLTDFGYGVYEQHRLTRAEAIAQIANERADMLDPRSLLAFAAARTWLRQFDKRKTANGSGTAYGLKHVAEPAIGYTTNGIFIAAAIAEGFTIKRCPDGPNAWINIVQAAFRHGNG